MPNSVKGQKIHYFSRQFYGLKLKSKEKTHSLLQINKVMQKQKLEKELPKKRLEKKEDKKNNLKSILEKKLKLISSPKKS